LSGVQVLLIGGPQRLKPHLFAIVNVRVEQAAEQLFKQLKGYATAFSRPFGTLQDFFRSL